MSRGKRKTPDTVTLGFESDCVTVPVAAVLPVRALNESVKSSRKVLPDECEPVSARTGWLSPIQRRDRATRRERRRGSA